MDLIFIIFFSFFLFAKSKASLYEQSTKLNTSNSEGLKTLSTNNTERKLAKKATKNQLPPREDALSHDKVMFEESYPIEEPELAISTQSVFDDHDLKSQIEDAENRYRGQDIEDASWMDLDQKDILIQVERGKDTALNIRKEIVFEQSRIIEGIIIGELLQKPKSKR